MTRERMFYIATRICEFICERDFQPEFEKHEVNMYISDLANDINLAIEFGDENYLETYYKRLNEEIEQLTDTDWIDEANELLELLDEWRTAV